MIYIDWTGCSDNFKSIFNYVFSLKTSRELGVGLNLFLKLNIFMSHQLQTKQYGLQIVS